MFDFVVIDYESDPIEPRPNYPPMPVGVSVKWPGEKSKYFAFGHKVGQNNSTWNDARYQLCKVLSSGLPILAHNMKFDIAITNRKFELVMPQWHEMHDTMFLAFLCDPHAKSHGLKELANERLNWPPEEKDAIAAYVWNNKDAIEQMSGRVVKRRQKREDDGTVLSSNAIEFLRFCPPSLVGPYAEGDTDRTAALFVDMYAEVEERGMMRAYDRERQLMPILLEQENDGIRIDRQKLYDDVQTYSSAMDHVENSLRARLGAPSLNFDADQDFAQALIRADIVNEGDFERTPAKGEYRVGKDALTPAMFKDPLVASAIGYRNRLKTCMVNFMEPWLEQSTKNSRGHVATGWNQTRGTDGGARTGRPSTSGEFNLLNIAKSFEGRTDGYVHPEGLSLPPLPRVRQYMLADEGEVWLNRDFSGQELRVFAHFECGDLRDAYLADPNLDPHGFVKQQLFDMTGVDMERTRVKVMNFQSLYGGGAGAIQKALGCTTAEAKEFKNYHDQGLPGKRILNEVIDMFVRRDEPLVTWGGRQYYVEEPSYSKETGRRMTWNYKLINYLVQGSAADLTKDAIIDWYNHPLRKSRFLATVYDEISLSAPEGDWERQMTILKDVMGKDRLDIKMLSDGKYGPGWGYLTKCF